MDIAESQKYHTSRREKSVTATIEKSKTPMVWLDTSLLVGFAKVENGEKIEPVRAKRLTRLRAVIRQAVRNEKLVCRLGIRRMSLRQSGSRPTFAESSATSPAARTAYRTPVLRMHRLQSGCGPTSTQQSRCTSRRVSTSMAIP
jgi:hypothetical protein